MPPDDEGDGLCGCMIPKPLPCATCDWWRRIIGRMTEDARNRGSGKTARDEFMDIARKLGHKMN